MAEVVDFECLDDPSRVKLNSQVNLVSNVSNIITMTSYYLELILQVGRVGLGVDADELIESSFEFTNGNGRFPAETGL